MRNFIIGLLLIGFTACSTIKKKPHSPIKDDNLIGTWKHYSSRTSDGAAKYLTIIPDSIAKLLIFYKNGRLGGNYLAEYPKAKYFVINNKLTGYNEVSVKVNGKYKHVFDYATSNESLNFIYYPYNCDEGCSENFVKVNSKP